MVHQQFRLVSRFTVAENLMLGDRRGAGRRFRIDPGAVDAQVRELGQRYGLDVDPRARIWQLSVGEQQRVEILKALYQNARILILDEPTAVLVPRRGRRALRHAASDGQRGSDGHLHLAQAARGEGRLGPRHRAPGREGAGDGADRRGDAPFARDVDGRPRHQAGEARGTSPAGQHARARGGRSVGRGRPWDHRCQGCLVDGPGGRDRGDRRRRGQRSA